MDLSEFMNIILGGGLVGTVAAIGSLRATVRKAKAEAMKAEAGAEAMRIDNAEHATRILMENIVKPLKDESHRCSRYCFGRGFPPARFLPVRHEAP